MIIQPSPIVFCALWFVLGCNDRPGRTDFAPQKEEEDSFVYEGRIPLDEDRTLYLELSMMASGMVPGEGEYALTETIEEGEHERLLSSIQGLYSASASDGGAIILQLHHSSLDTALRRVWFSEDRRRLYEKPFRTADLVLRSAGDDKLIVLDAGGPVTVEDQYNLVRRTSQLFTVEGYFQHGELSSLYEINTKRSWHVSRYGDYYRAARSYHALTKKNSDSVYLKAVGFRIACVDTYGCEGQALFLKKVIQMGM